MAVLGLGNSLRAWPVYRAILDQLGSSPSSTGDAIARVDEYIKSAPAPIGFELTDDARRSPAVRRFVLGAVGEELRYTPWLALPFVDVIRAAILDTGEASDIASRREGPWPPYLDVGEDAAEYAWHAYQRSLEDRAPLHRSRALLRWAAGLGSRDAVDHLTGISDELQIVKWLGMSQDEVWRGVVSAFNSKSSTAFQAEFMPVLQTIGSRIRRNLRTAIQAASDPIGLWLRDLAIGELRNPWHGEASAGLAVLAWHLLVDEP